MNKVYIVTEGNYSDYHIEACFTTKEKAKEYIKNAKKTGRGYCNIETYDLDTNSDIVKAINIYFTFTSPFSKKEHKEEIKTSVKDEIRSQVYSYNDKIEFYGFDYDIVKIREIANPNKTIEEEISRLTKVAYDTAKKIDYLYKVENIKTLEGIRKRLN